MKKVIVSIALIAAAATSASAQFSITAGYINNGNTVSGLNKGVSEIMKMKGSESRYDINNIPLTATLSQNGGYIGVSYGIGLGDGGFKFTPGIQFQMANVTAKVAITKNAQNFQTVKSNAAYTNEVAKNGKIKASINSYDVVVPLKFSYEFETAGAVKPYIFVDPSIRCGVAFNVTGEVSSGEEPYKTRKAFNLYNPDIKSAVPEVLLVSKDGEDPELDDDTANMIDRYAKLNRFDVMLGGGFGMIISDHIGIEFGYNFGLLNKLPRHDDAEIDITKFKFRTNTFFAGISYIF
ncbi:MAG: outer membrane beta-barrel protein [Bacteroidales bacterium]|nr:outer membrane beta-barrel protein [Bacteroidales bacterium]